MAVMKLFFRYFFKTIRLIIGPIILLADKLTTPRGIKRPAEQQAKIDSDTKKLGLYQFAACPFCIKTRRAIKRLSLNIETYDAQHNTDYREQLLTGGGQIKVPCLKISDDQGNNTWMYESSEIIQYLQDQYATNNS